MPKLFNIGIRQSSPNPINDGMSKLIIHKVKVASKIEISLTLYKEKTAIAISPRATKFINPGNGMMDCAR